MNNLTLSYPPMPEGANKNIIKPSPAFKHKVYNAIAAIGLFVVSYLFLFAVAIGIAIAFGYIGITIIAAGVGFMGMVAGAGLILSGLMLVFFVVKFLFKKSHTDYSGMIEITEAEQPQLFAFINKITEEAEAPKPKRIYISPDVNASVFYDSSFWSMFFPVKKNLKIGLGLVNSVNVSEFKAVMAHEFGHFSQRSMKFGSYVYNLNKVIYNMLYDNEGYQKALSAWASLHAILRLMAMLNVKIIEGMQWILRQVYVVLNKSHMSLSRQMEFHADAVSAYVTGSNHLVTSLKRLEIGQVCYDGLLEYWNAKLAENKRSANFYPEHQEMIRVFADKRLIPVDDAGLPVIEKGMEVVDGSDIVIENQWSSHPSTEDREGHLEKINLITATHNESAWCLFNNAEELQLKLTNFLYDGVEKAKGASSMSLAAFMEDYHASIDTRSLDRRYRNYYDRNINEFDVDAAIDKAPGRTALTFDELFTPENCALPKIVERAESDAQTMDIITEVRKDIKKFDYKGTKYGRDDAPYVKTLIEKEQAVTQQAVEKLDEEVFAYFYKKAHGAEKKALLAAKYRALFVFQQEAVKEYARFNDIMVIFNKVYETMPLAQIHETVDAVYEKEKDIKPSMTAAMEAGTIKAHLSDADTEAINNYLNTTWAYFSHSKYDNDAIAAFDKGTGAYVEAISDLHFEMKKDLLNFQLNLLDSKA
ncbi:M48 family metallopeptidase [Mucilaginibacter pedocola]|uniref:Peptidase M48 domain-containing protein n=1 Tax=Mucilaginibacter pedocola TaxID=1792845 RepID=A0A1S9PAI6_9SPHI|nr:M48 family metallopeptidase [Mucilaginibacter pedocola]OOQ57939.1 hypothetical protein BC343_09685 [Mucilaginibacter pedocola]